MAGVTPALLTASTFNRLGQYASSPGNRAYCYAELAVSSLAVAVTIASTHFAGWLAWVTLAWTLHPRTATPGWTSS